LKTTGHILIINYDFPPNAGIGGRRWAKFAKQLAALGYEVHVIKADAIVNNVASVWEDDVKHDRIHVHSLRRYYPLAFSHPKTDIISRIVYRFYKWKLERQEAGTIYDISIGWKKPLQEKIRELLALYSITNVMATGAPWKMLADVAEMKHEFPSINLIIDYRDPWLNAVNYGMAGLSAARRKEEERKQRLILENASVITTPYEYLSEELKGWAQVHCKIQNQFEVLTHFYDPDDLQYDDVNFQNGQITFIYGGDLYQGIDNELQLLRRQLEELKQKNSALYSKLRIKFFTNKTETKTFAGVDCVEIHPFIGKAIFKEATQASAILIILPKNKCNDRTTKFFENLPLRKPFVVLSQPGVVSKFVVEHQLGFELNEKSASLQKIVEQLDSGKFNLNRQFDYQQYSLSNVTKQLIGYFK